jgi:membrane carboxypeptidase/penicillin-binding protein PbpC
MRITARQMLSRSINAGALRLAELLGPARVHDALQRAGFSVPANRRALANALGAGVMVNLYSAAAAFSFDPANPGCRLKPYALFAAEPCVRNFDIRAALAVYDALTSTAREGTARRVMSRVADAAEGVALKTGSAGFRDKSGRWEGEGGSWVLAAFPDGARLAVRVRYEAPGVPFEVSASDSAALVLRNYLTGHSFMGK